MKLFSFSIFFILSALHAVAQPQPNAQPQPDVRSQTVVIRAGTLLDGKGHSLHNVLVVVQDGKIVRVEPNAKEQRISGAAVYNLTHMTVMPGWIDLHDHIVWHFGPNGCIEDKSETPWQAALAVAGNAYATLMAGFTTIQSVGSPEDKDLRAVIQSGDVPGPRLLTSLEPIEDPKLTPEQIRETVRKLKADGADLVKIFASRSIRQGGTRTMTDEQLQAACSEAKARAADVGPRLS
ncbi:MAG: amidohydrolase family protein [Candidatus Angelobacter sp.]